MLLELSPNFRHDLPVSCIDGFLPEFVIKVLPSLLEPGNLLQAIVEVGRISTLLVVLLQGLE